MTELVRTYKLTDSGAWGWMTEEAEGGGGGLPVGWTQEDDGTVTVTLTEVTATALKILLGVDGARGLFIDGHEADSYRLLFDVQIPEAGVGFVYDTDGVLSLVNKPDGDDLFIVNGTEDSVQIAADNPGQKVGFFGTAPVVRPTGVAVTAGGIHAALVSLGLIAA